MGRQRQRAAQRLPTVSTAHRLLPRIRAGGRAQGGQGGHIVRQGREGTLNPVGTAGAGLYLQAVPGAVRRQQQCPGRQLMPGRGQDFRPFFATARADSAEQAFLLAGGLLQGEGFLMGKGGQGFREPFRAAAANPCAKALLATDRFPRRDPNTIVVRQQRGPPPLLTDGADGHLIAVLRAGGYGHAEGCAPGVTPGRDGHIQFCRAPAADRP